MTPVSSRSTSQGNFAHPTTPAMYFRSWTIVKHGGSGAESSLDLAALSGAALFTLRECIFDNARRDRSDIGDRDRGVRTR